MSDETIIRRLREERDELQERVRQLEAQLACPTVLPFENELTRKEAIIARLLVTREVATTDAIMMALYSDRIAAPDPQIISVLISGMRPKLERHGLEIRTVRARGYAIPPEQRSLFWRDGAPA